MTRLRRFWHDLRIGQQAHLAIHITSVIAARGQASAYDILGDAWRGYSLLLVHRATPYGIYQALRALESAGIITRHEDADGKRTYTLAGAV